MFGAALFAWACDAGRLSEACEALANQYADGRGVPQDAARAEQYRARALEFEQ